MRSKKKICYNKKGGDSMIRIFIVVVFLMSSFIVNIGSGAAKFTVVEVEPRIVTPDSPNQEVRIRVGEGDDTDLIVTGCIFDITGREVALMEPEGNFWDDPTGFMDLTWRPGDNISSGVYIYQLEAGGYIYNGTIVVAR
jgi:hypothetical protein